MVQPHSLRFDYTPTIREMNMPEWTPEYMNELVSIDLDLPLIKRWQSMAIFWPDMADSLARAYGTKQERKEMKELLKKNETKTQTNKTSEHS